MTSPDPKGPPKVPQCEHGQPEPLCVACLESRPNRIRQLEAEAAAMRRALLEQLWAIEHHGSPSVKPMREREELIRAALTHSAGRALLEELGEAKKRVQDLEREQEAFVRCDADLGAVLSEVEQRYDKCPDPRCGRVPQRDPVPHADDCRLAEWECP